MHHSMEQDFENRRLGQTIAVAQEQLASLRSRSEENKAAIISAKKEMRENTSHSIGGLWSLDNFLDLVALSQYASPVSESISDYERDVTKILALERLINSPYFARIDFKFEGENSFENIYIGRSSLQDDKTREMYVYDWRSPISSVFYRFGTGKAFYEAPAGRINGEVSLKRQYEISHGKLEFFFDADVQIIDGFLRKILSQNTSAKMKTIVETIQKDQDMIIRDTETELLMVQGAAGSGKTSVALHRIAYLMYQGLSAKLSHQDIVIISPNRLFEHYISTVLPELGEKNVNSLVFEEILSRILPDQLIQSRHQFLEAILSVHPENGKSIAQKSMAYKGSAQFIELLNRFIQELPCRWIDFDDVYYNGRYVVKKELLKNKVLRDSKSLLGSRLKQLETIILKSVHQERPNRMEKLKKLVAKENPLSRQVEAAARRLSIRESSVLNKKIRQFTEINCLELYRQLFNDKKAFYRLAEGLKLPDDISAIIDFTCENLQDNVLTYDDALAIVFLHLKTMGSADYKEIKQVVIDEAQDYYPLHFEILHSLFPQAHYTILGDIHQTIGKKENISLYDQASKILSKSKSMLLTLDKSFRSTNEILMYSSKFLDPDIQLNSFSRQGDEPSIVSAPNQAALNQLMIAEISACQKRGYRSIGLICKSEREAISLYEQLKSQTDLLLIKNNVQFDLTGVFIIPVYLSKGLEFDAVLICTVDNEHYHSEDDKNLLYIACTRALHRLSLFYAGTASPLLNPQ